MRVFIDKAACKGNARCAALSETLFRLDEDGYIAEAEMVVPAGMETIALRGARACPERAITIVEDEQ